MSQNLTIRKAKENEIGWVNARYDEVGFKHADFTEDIILIAEVDGKKAGLGRLQPIDSESSELGGMYVFSAYRKAGVARLIVEELLVYAKDYEYIYCLPFAHLAQFYRSFGFANVTDNQEVPEAISSKLNWCNNTYPDLTLVLVRPGSMPSL